MRIAGECEGHLETFLRLDLVALRLGHRPGRRGAADQSADQRALAAAADRTPQQGARRRAARDRADVTRAGRARDHAVGLARYFDRLALEVDRREPQHQHRAIALLRTLGAL